MKKLLLIISITIMMLALGASAVYAAGDDFIPYKVICNGKSLDKGYEYHNNIYISLEDFLEYGETEHLTFDRSRNQIFFDPADFDIYIGDTQTSSFIQENAGTVHISMKYIGSDVYVPLKLLSQLARLDYEITGERITLYPQSSSADLMRINCKCSAAASISQASGQNYVLAEGQLCSVIKQYAAFSLVDIMGGEKVYVLSDCISPLEEDDIVPDFTFKAKTKAEYDRQINVVWDGSPTTPAVIEDGLDVICPFEWFYQMVEKDGVLGNNANIGYTDTAHQLGYQVWATVTNAFTTTGSSKYTTKVLADEALRNKTAAQYLFYAALYNVDGLNVDYEDMNSKGADKAGFTKLIETLSEYTNRMGLTLSVAPLVPEKWNFTLYDYARLGELCDYITVMTYDQRTKLSDGPGSTSSKSWYTRNLNTLKEYVPAEKILMGVPFYSFVNRYDYSGNYVSFTRWNTKVLANYVAYAQRDGRVIEGPVWKEADGQYYIKYYDSDGKYINVIWLEDERSLLTRIQTAVDAEIAGTICWQINYVDPSYYSLFKRVYVDGELTSDIISTLEEY